MNPEDLLEASLLDLLYELQGADLCLILGGGYGLYRKRLYALPCFPPIFTLFLMFIKLTRAYCRLPIPAKGFP